MKKFIVKFKKILRKVWVILVSPTVMILILLSSVIPLTAFEAHVVNITAKIERRPCVIFETRSYGFWKTHEEARIYPQTLGEELIDDNAKADTIFNLPDNIMLNKLKKQLLALKFNVSFYNSGTALVASDNTITINDLIAIAEAMITSEPPASKDELEDMKNKLESANTSGTLSTCPREEGSNNNNQDIQAAVVTGGTVAETALATSTQQTTSTTTEEIATSTPEIALEQEAEQVGQVEETKAESVLIIE